MKIHSFLPNIPTNPYQRQKTDSNHFTKNIMVTPEQPNEDTSRNLSSIKETSSLKQIVEPVVISKKNV